MTTTVNTRTDTRPDPTTETRKTVNPDTATVSPSPAPRPRTRMPIVGSRGGPSVRPAAAELECPLQTQDAAEVLGVARTERAEDTVTDRVELLGETVQVDVIRGDDRESPVVGGAVVDGVADDAVDHVDDGRVAVGDRSGDDGTHGNLRWSCAGSDR